MKTLFLALAISIIAIACESASSTAVENFIPGIYVCPFKDSISPTSNVKGLDSLIIKNETEKGSDSYEIKRFLAYQRMADSIVLPVEHKEETWTGIYDKENKVIKTSPSGKILSFDMKKNVLKIDGKEYIKRE
jgi:hypothetical protein